MKLIDKSKRIIDLHSTALVACLILTLAYAHSGVFAYIHSDVSNVTRLEHGDSFSIKGADCIKRECGGRGESLSCLCSCPAHAPLFREDKGECVDDITECLVAPFGIGSTSQRIPYVFLPLKGQIIHPSKEISFPGVRTPICAVSGAQFLTRNGFVDLRNTIDSDVPFSLFRDEGRTFLQWTGEPEIRQRMEGRLLVVHLLCRDVGAGIGSPKGLHGVFTPCATFRVAGSPTRHVTNVSEVLFSPDARSSDDTTGAGLTLSEYVAIGICSVLLGLIYVASIFLYLHIKRKRGKNEVNPEAAVKNLSRSKRKEHSKLTKDDTSVDNRGSTVNNINNMEQQEDGVVKSNPLLGIGRHYRGKDSEFESDSGSCPTDGDDPSEETADEDIKDHSSSSMTVRPLIHGEHGRKNLHRNRHDIMVLRDDSGFERLPEENVSIVETSDFRDDKPENVRAIGNTRRKLYFNPAYFEPHLLMEPPPAAIEFLTKIREVITIAKHKMASKRFTPSLIGIPEEDTCVSFENVTEFYHAGSQRSSMISLKRENNRRRIQSHCSGCPGCENIDVHEMYVPDVRNFGACNACSHGINKQSSIRKWLEGVPLTSKNEQEQRMAQSRMLNALMSLPKDNSPERIHFHVSRSLYNEEKSNNFVFKKKGHSSVRSEPSSFANSFNIPLPEFDNVQKQYEREKTIAKITDISPIGFNNKDQIKHSMPDMINEALAIDKNAQNPSTDEDVPSKIKKDYLSNMMEKQKIGLDYETDSLERHPHNKGFSTPTEYADVSSSQASPSLSSALPMDEEMTLTNAIYKSSSRPSSSRSSQSKEKTPEKDHTLNVFDNQIYSMMEMQSNPRDYSLVTEVYVNNGYNFGSTPTTPSGSECSTFGRRRRKNIIKGPEELPGHLTIEVKDPPENYIKIHESDGFEPDTLDRKPNKIKINISNTPEKPERTFILSPLPENYDIKATGIFKSTNFNSDDYEKDFNSLRDVYEPNKSNKSETNSLHYYPPSTDSRDYEIIENTKNTINSTEEGRILTLESRHTKRQRQSTPPNMKGILSKLIPPDVVPDQILPIYEYPKPPRKVMKDLPPLPPKNENDRSPECSRRIKRDTDCGFLRRSPSGASVHEISSDYENIEAPPIPEVQTKKMINFREHQTPKAGRKTRNGGIPTRKNSKLDRKENEHNKKLWGRGNQYKEDSGYLSTDSNESRRLHKRRIIATKENSDSDEYAEDARSESGAESIETHSVFFGSLRKSSLISGSVDSGTESEIRISEIGSAMERPDSNCYQDNDCDEISFVTVVPFDKNEPKKFPVHTNC